MMIILQLLCAILGLSPLLISAVDDPDLGFNLLFSGVGGAEVLRQRLTINGSIPAWLTGALIHNGGGRFEWPDSKVRRNLTNAGDGYAKLEVFEFRDGGVTYTSKFARTQWWNESCSKHDIAPSLSFGVPDPPRLSDKLGLPNVLAPNDNLAVNIVSLQQRILMISDQPGSIEFDLDTLEFGVHASPMPPHPDFEDVPPLPPATMGIFGSAHPQWTGSSLDSSGDVYGLLNVQRLLKAEKQPEQIRLFKISAEDQQPGGPNPWLTRHAITTLNVTKGPNNKDGFAPYMHSFFLVGGDRDPKQTHAVLVQHAMNIAMANLIAGLGLKPISSGFDIDTSRPMVFHIIRLSTGELERTISVDMEKFTEAASTSSLIVSHTINGYFDGEERLVLDVIGYDFLFFNRFEMSEVLNKTARDKGQYGGKRAKTFRFVLDVANGVAVSVSELLPKSDWEFPTYNEGRKGRPYCFAYGYEFHHDNAAAGVAPAAAPAAAPVAPAATGMASMAVVKYNFCASIGKDGRRQAQTFKKPFHYFMEPWFVPRPNATAEDDGVVLALATDGATANGVLFVLDAGSLEVLASMRLPVLVSFKTHGRFMWGHGNSG